MQYLDRADADEACARLSELCGALLYFSVLTREDWKNNCDRRLTDGEVNLRPVRWYRRRLQRHFRQVGAGVFLARAAAPVVFALDALT